MQSATCAMQAVEHCHVIRANRPQLSKQAGVCSDGPIDDVSEHAQSDCSETECETGRRISTELSVPINGMPDAITTNSLSPLSIAYYAVIIENDHHQNFQKFLPRDASAERGDATVSRPSVCPSVCLSVCNNQVPWTHRLEFFENNFTAE